jgi:hypothetical protein
MVSTTPGRADHGVQAAQPRHRVGHRAARAMVVGEVGRDGRVPARQIDDAHDLGAHLGERARQGAPQSTRRPGHRVRVPAGATVDQSGMARLLPRGRCRQSITLDRPHQHGG